MVTSQYIGMFTSACTVFCNINLCSNGWTQFGGTNYSQEGVVRLDELLFTGRDCEVTCNKKTRNAWAVYRATGVDGAALSDYYKSFIYTLSVGDKLGSENSYSSSAFPVDGSLNGVWYRLTN